MIKFLNIISIIFLLNQVCDAQICFQYYNVDSLPPLDGRELATGDFNHDGYKDFAVRAMQATVMYGNGTNVFSLRHSFPLPFNRMAMTAADMNGDSLTDLIFAYDSIYIYISTGTSSFNKNSFSINGTINKITSADFDGDNKIDLLATIHSSNDSLAFFKGDGNGNILSALTSNSANSGGVIRVVDLNNDNNVDAAIMNLNGIQLMTGDGAGGFLPAQMITYPTNNMFDFAFGDLDSDNDPDLVVPMLNVRDSLLLYINNGSGLFMPGNKYLTKTTGGVDIADVNNDGDNDVITTEINSGASLFMYGFIEIHFGDGNGAFTNTKFYNGGGKPASVIVDDFTNDNIPDIATANNSDTSFTILIQSSGVTDVQISTVQPTCPSQWGSASAIATGTGPFVYTWLYGFNDTGQVINYILGSINLMVSTSNGCHLIDTIFIKEIPKISFRDSVFTTTCIGTAVVDISSLVTGGTMPYQYTWNTVPVQNTPLLNGMSPGEYILNITDSNNCTAADTILVPSISLFDTGSKYHVPTSPEFIRTADFNEDSLPDLVTLNSNKKLYIFINNGVGGFLPPVMVNPAVTGYNFQLKTADFNNDSHTDIVMSNNTKVILFNGDGHGTFSNAFTTTLPDFVGSAII